ncbi:MAG: hypothetical protein HF312_21695 [Ignavibacteria bacterium]|jgi:hypothetical protein|nr:hypothetical protein [Ignavibacteria bacterium]
MENKDREKLFRVEMARCGHTQRDIAALMGMTLSAFNRRIKGRIKWQISELEKAAGIYGKDRKYFV